MTTTSVTTSTTSVYTETSGNELLVESGGNVTSAIIDNGGSLVVSGGVDTSATISSGGTETVSSGGSASGDQIYGTLTVTGAASTTVTNETVFNGGVLDLYKGAAIGTTVDSGGVFNISGGNTASNTVLSGGGEVELATSGATLAGTLTFEAGGNTLLITKVLSSAATSGVTIEGFSSTDQIVVSGATTVAVSSSGGHEIATISSGGVTDTLTFSGSQYTNSTLSWVTSGSAEVLEYTPAASGTTTSVTTSTASGAYTETSGNTLLVETGGSVSATTIDNGAFLVVSGGADYAAVISSGGTETISAGSATGDQIAGNATVSAGGTVTSENVLSGGALTINGGADSAATISAHGAETVFGGGSATGDQIFGTLSTISGNSAALTSETVENGGTLNLLNGDSAIGTTVLSGGMLFISGADNEANNTTLSGGGTLNLASPKATISGSLTLEGGDNTLEATAIATSGYGDQAVISGFSSTDEIAVSGIGTSATLSVVSSGGNDYATISGASGSETFIFGDTSTYTNNTLYIQSSGGVVDLEYNPNPTTLTVSSGTTSNGLTVSADVTLTVQSGGTASATIVDAGGMEIVSGADVSATISAGGTETVAAGGSASGDEIYGSAIVSGVGGVAASETVLSGGSLTVGGGAAASNIVLSGGGVVELASPTATLSGALTFSGGGNTLGIASIASSGDGEQAVISGFSITDQIAISGVGADPTLSFSTSGGNEVVTVSGASGAETLIFSGTSTYTSNTLSLASSGGAVDLEYSSATSVTTSTASGAYTEAARNILIVEQGGSVSAATIESGASLIVSGGADYAAAILAGAVETISAGSAIGDQIYGGATVDASATVTSETVEDGGALAIGSGATASNIVLNGGGTVELESPTATLSGSLTFSDGGNTLDIDSLSSAGDGVQAVISGFSSADNIVISGVGAGATLSFSSSGDNEVVTVSGSNGSETLTFAGASTYTSSTLSLVTSGGAVDLETSAAPSDLGFQAYNSGTASTISAGPLALYSVAVDDIAPTQMNEGFTEVDAKAAAFDLFTTSAALEADLMGDIEPVVIGPGGQLYLLDGHHTFTALIDSSWGASDPTVYVNVIANYSSDSETQFIAQMEANNWLLPLNDGVPQTVNSTTGAPIPTTLTGLTSNVYRGLEYSILKQKDSKLFTTTANITGATGAKTPGLDKMPGLYSDFAEAAAYQDADAGLGLPYLSPGDIALATQWNLNPLSTTTLPNVSGTVYAYQLPGFILSQNVVISASISNATLGNSEPGNGSMEGAIDGNGTFTGITEINAGTTANPIYIDTPNIGLIMQVGADRGYDVTLTNTDNTYIGGTTFLAGTLAIVGDGSLGAAPTESNAAFDASLTFDTEGFADNVTAAVQADNGIIFNSLSEGNGTLTIGTTAGAFTSASPFTTSRVIAVGNEAATVNVNGSYVELEGQLVTLGYDNLGLGETAGFPAFTIDDLSSGGGKTATAGTLVLSTPSPYFYGDVIIGDTGTPTVEVMSDAALGSTTGNGNADAIGEVELNGGTLQTGASFAAPERDINVEGGSQIDLDGETTSWGSLTDVKRTIAIVNSSATAGAIAFNNLTISQTSILQLDGSANGTTYTGGETVTFTNGILQTAASDTLVLNASSSTALGTTEQVYSAGASAQLIDGIAPVWIVTNEGSSSGPYDFVSYGADGYVQESGAATTLSAATGSDVVELAASTTASGSLAAYALNTNAYSISLGSNTLTIGDGTDDAGLILANGSAINGGTLAFGGSQGVVWLSGSATISSEITGGNGLTFAGSGAVNLGTAANVSGVVTIDSGTVTLSAANVFANDVAGVELGDVKSKPSNSILDLTASQTFATLNSIGSKSAINIGAGDTLTIGDTTNNESSTLSSTITNASNSAPAIVTAGSGLVDLSGATLTLVAGSTIDATGGELRVATGALTNSATAGSAPDFVLSNNAQLQFAQSEGQYAGSISGDGSLDLVSGTLQLTGANSYTGDTVLTTGTTLDVTTTNLPVGNDIVTASGSLVDFDQTTSGAFGGVISGTGSLDKDDSATDGAGDVTLTAAQTFTGATYVEAGTLTLGVVDAVAESTGVTLGRVGGGATATLALGADNTLASLSSNASNTTSVVLNGNVLTLDPSTSTSFDFGGAIVDGSAAGSLVIDGAGDAELTGANTFSGGTTLDSGTLELGANDSAGTGAITFGSASALLQLDAILSGGATAFANTLTNIVVGDQIDLDGLQFESGATTATVSGSTLTVTNGTASETFTLNNPATTNFTVAADNTGGVLLTAATAIAPTIAGTHTTGTSSETPVTPFAGVTIADANDGGTDTDTLSITLSGGGALSGTGLSGSNGSYSLSGTAAAITSQLDALSFTPVDGVPNTSATTSFTLSDLSSAFATPTVDGTTTVVDTDPAVAPTITGTHTTDTTSEAAVTPFSGVTIGDANSGASDTVTIAVGGAGGALTGADLSGGTGGVYTLTGAASAVTSELDALVFTPTAGTPNGGATSTFTLSDLSSAYATATVNNSTTVTDTDPAVAPTITGTHAADTTSEAPVTPFSGVTIADANNGATDTDTLSITLSGGGALADGASFTGTSSLSGSNGSYTLSGTAAAITSELDALVFTPIDGVPNTSATTSFTLSDTNSTAGATSASDSTTVVTDTDPAVAPTITGTHATDTTSEAPVTPFSGVTIADANNGATDTDTLSITLSGGGALADGASFTGASSLSGSNGSYSLTGTAAAITSELQAISFTPVDGVPDTSATTSFTLSDLSGAFATPTVDSATTVTDSDPAVAPTITGTVADQTTTSEAPIKPFSRVTIADPNAGATDTLTIAVGGSGGALSGTGLSGGTAGVYTLTGSAASITSELHALSFTPKAGAPNTTSTSTFVLSDSTSAGTSVSDSATTVVDSDPAVAPTITGTVAGQTTTSEAPIKPFSRVTIADPNAGATDTLTITVGGSGGALSGTGLSGGTAGVYTLTGSAATVTSELDALSFTPTAGAPYSISTSTFALSDTSSVYGTPTVDTTTTVVDSDAATGSVVLNIATAVADELAGIVIHVPPGDTVTVADTAANIASITHAQANALKAAGYTSIASTNGAVTLTMATALILSGDNLKVTGGLAIVAGTVAATLALTSATVGSLIADGFAIGVLDTAAHIEALTATQIASLSALHVVQIAASDTSMALSVAQAVALEGADIDVVAPTGDKVTASDTAAHLETLTAAQIRGLPAIGVSGVTATNASVALAVAQAQALETANLKVTVPSGDKVTISDTTANIAALTALQIEGLPAVGVSGVAATGGSVALSVAQALALEGDDIKLTVSSGYKVTISDTAANVAALTAAQIAALPAAGVSGIAATGGGMALTVAQAVALESAALTLSVPAGDYVVLSDTAAHIEALTAAQIAGLSALHVTKISASDTSVALSVAQAVALEAANIPVVAPTGAKVSVLDTAADLETLTAAQITALPAIGISGVTANNASVALTVAQALALETANLKVVVPSGDEVTISDKAANITALTAAQIVALSATGVSEIVATNASVVLTVAQALALETADLKLAVPNGDKVTISDKAANIAALTAAQIAALPAAGVSGVAATGGSVALTVAKALALETADLKLTVPSGDKVTISDLAANIAALTTAQIAALPAAGVSGVAATGGSVALTVAQALALETADLKLTVPSGDKVTISDLAANIMALTTAQIAALPAAGVSGLVATDRNVTLSVAQAVALERAALTLSLPAGDYSVLSDTAAHIEALTAAEIASLSSLHVAKVSASDTSVALSVAQAVALEGADISVGAPTGSNVTLSDTAAHLETLTAAQITALPGLGVDELYSTNGNVSYTAAQTSAILSRGLEVAATGSDTVTENFANGDDLVYSNGLLIQQKTVNADGSYDIAYTNVTGQTYSSYENIYNSAGTRVAEAFDNLNGSGSLTLHGNDLTVTSASGAESLTTGADTFALNPHSVETITASGTTKDVFVYTPGFGQDAITGFLATGANHDLLQFNASGFSYLTPGESQAADLAAVLGNATQTAAGNTVITDSLGDSLTLNAVTKTTLAANAADFKFV